MKKLFLAAFTLLSVSAIAQPIVVAKGKVFKMKSEINSNVNMGMGLETKSDMSFENKLTYTGEENGKPVFMNEFVKLKSKATGMGNTMEYDSEKPNEASPQMKEMMGDMEKTKTKMLVDKNTGETTVVDPEKNLPVDRDVTAGMDMFNFNNASTNNGVFMILPKNLKAGTIWKDSSASIDGNKMVNTYTVEKIENGATYIDLTSTMGMKGDREVQGMPVKMDMQTVSTGKIKVDNKTYVVLKRKVDANISGTMEIQGMPMSLSGLTTAEVEIE